MAQNKGKWIFFIYYIVKKFIQYAKHVFLRIGRLLFWLMPLALLLIAISLPKLFWHLNFKDFLEFLKVLIWPFTALTILFFFKQVVTYLFFSMDEFNFFGAKGNLKNVNEVITEGVNKKFLEEINERERAKDMEKMSKRLATAEKKASTAQGAAGENLQLARDIFKNYKDSEKQNQEIVSGLEAENKRLREIISGLPPQAISDESSVSNIDNRVTSDPVSEETSQ